MKSIYLSADLGGSSLRIALIEESGDILQRWRFSSDEVRKPEKLVGLFQDYFEQSLAIAEKSKRKIVGASLGIPGLVQYPSGIVLSSPHFPEWESFPLKAILSDQFPFPVFIENDANQAALGECFLGAGRDWEDFILLTLGTGVGGGIILGRRLYRGPEGFAGEFGHMTIDRHSWPGSLAISGSLESIVSLSGLQHRFRWMQAHKIDFPKLDFSIESPDFALNLAKLARLGDAFAIEVWRDFGAALACGISNLVNSFGVFNYIIGGGLLGAWDLYAPSCLQELPCRNYPTLCGKIQMIPAQLKEDAGLLGALPAVQEGLKKPTASF